MKDFASYLLYLGMKHVVTHQIKKITWFGGFAFLNALQYNKFNVIHSNNMTTIQFLLP